MNLEKLLSDYNRLTETKKHYHYNNLSDFCMWLSFEGYRLNNQDPIELYFKCEHNRANDFINETNLILTNVKIELDVIQFMQDKGLTFKEMSNLINRLDKKLIELNEKK